MIPLEPDPEMMRALGTEGLERIVTYLGERPAAPTQGPDDPGLVAQLAAPPPEDGEPFGDILEGIVAAAGPGIDTTNPGFLGFIPGGGLFAAALGEMLALNLNRYGTMRRVAPAMNALETSVTAWLAELCGMPETGCAVLTSGGSTATLSGLVAARVAHLGEDLRDARLYASGQSHQSVAKAARIAGLATDALVEVACDGRMRMDPAALAARIADDRGAGLRPFAIVANAGTTNTGAVDPLSGIADIAEREGLWLHVDAAYGGFFLLTGRGRALLAGIERADSITLDPHKGMFMPYGTGALVARDAERLRAAHGVSGAYLADVAGDAPDFADLSVELTREARGVRMWLPLHLHGVSAFRAALEEKLDLARELAEALRGVPELVVPWEPDLSVVSFHLRDAEDADAAHAELLAAINDSGRVLVTSTRIDAVPLLRACILCQRTDPARVREAAEIIAAAAARVSGR